MKAKQAIARLVEEEDRYLGQVDVTSGSSWKELNRLARRAVNQLHDGQAAVILRGRFSRFLLTGEKPAVERVIRKLTVSSLGESTDKLWTGRTLDTLILPRGLVTYSSTTTSFVAHKLRDAGIHAVVHGPARSTGMLCVCGAHAAGSGITQRDPYPLAVWYDGRYVLLRLLPGKLAERLPAATELDAAIVDAPDVFSSCIVAGERSLVRNALAVLRRAVTSDLLSAD